MTPAERDRILALAAELRDNNWLSTEPVTDTLSRWMRQREEAATALENLIRKPEDVAGEGSGI